MGNVPATENDVSIDNAGAIELKNENRLNNPHHFAD
jgi:hypothetical protein